MPEYGIIHRFAGGTREQYENVLKAVHPDGGLPAGQLFHFAGPTADGWIVVGIHDSKETWEAFRDGVLNPALPNVDNGLPGPPVETTFDVANHQQV
jgi:hypothetical protein